MVVRAECSAVVESMRKKPTLDPFETIDMFAGRVLKDVPVVTQTIPSGSLSVSSMLELVDQELRAVGIDLARYPNGLGSTVVRVASSLDGFMGAVMRVPGMPKLPTLDVRKADIQRRIAQVWLGQPPQTQVICAEYSGEIVTANAAYLFDALCALRATVPRGGGSEEVAYTVLPDLRQATFRPAPDSPRVVLQNFADLVTVAYR